ncbi:MAG: lipopolysaccharide heptosyltransferase II [Candidatus Omnitrophica bacterium]|nr:lipopolysaccharide heptosyltransferase II [Candidatus Omnitrophota bacterium]
MNKRIIIVRMDRIGDVVLSTPAIKAVRDAYPDSRIAVLVRPYAKDVVDGNPYIDEVITYDRSGKEKGLLGKIRFIADLKNKKFDLAIILHPKNSSHIIAYLAGIPKRLGYDKKLGIFLTKKIPHTKQYGLKHEIDYVLGLLRYIGIEGSDKSLHMPVNRPSEERIKGLFDKSGISPNDPVIVIHPAASCPSRRWALERFAKASDALAQMYGVRIVIISGPDGDKMMGDKVAELMKSKALNLAGKTSISDIASILRRSRLLISNDSGPVHISCAVGTPVISIFGRKDRGISPERWGPVGKRDIAQHKDAGCEICLAQNCKLGFKCLDMISVEDVLSAAEQILRPR